MSIHPLINESAVAERFVRASGPGGQNVNKVATAVELRFDLSRSSLPEDVKARLRTLAGSRLTREDVVVVDAREHRTQAQNREAARARLVALVEQATKKPRARRPTRPSKTSREKRVTSKTRRGAVKRLRSKGAAED